MLMLRIWAQWGTWSHHRHLASPCPDRSTLTGPTGFARGWHARATCTWARFNEGA